ncbi:exodeoxyribonuclease VII small subunit [uncultured Pseudokineococcus sp.]|uniref:exodeoxyribonuclease VII small subunit n=1 Tax=uncultured Pseudokineococcus sp. TaxID=1642928 RepID=UPI0026359804|nr:exodeoxyribonuclease VII small subunit [uncultured Pseudokineococcus sp.]
MARDDSPAAAGATAGDLSDLPAPSTLGYEQARDELVRVVAALEAGGTPLERSLALWERGEALASRCEEHLDGARRRLDEATAAHADRG